MMSGQQPPDLKGIPPVTEPDAIKLTDETVDVLTKLIDEIHAVRIGKQAIRSND